MTFDKSITKSYDDLRAKRLGLPEGMKPADDTELPGKQIKRKRKTCERDKHTARKMEKSGWKVL